MYTDAARGWEIVSEVGTGTETPFDYVKVSDVKAYNVAGGTFTQGAWRTRVINTEDSDASSICSIASNQITLAAGTYICSILCPSFGVNQNGAILYNITDSEITLIGIPQHNYYFATYAVVSGGLSAIKGKFTIAVETVFEVQHYCKLTRASNGFGVALSVAGVDSVYTVAEFWRVS